MLEAGRAGTMRYDDIKSSDSRALKIIKGDDEMLSRLISLERNFRAFFNFSNRFNEISAAGKRRAMSWRLQ